MRRASLVLRVTWIGAWLVAGIGGGCGGPRAGVDRGAAGGLAAGDAAGGVAGAGGTTASGAGGRAGGNGAVDAHPDATFDARVETGGLGGAAGGTGGAAGGVCKRGIASNTAPGAAFFPAVGWWYDWSPRVGGAGSPLEFAPMIWGPNDLTAILPPSSRYLLGFNEPNFHAQANLTAQQAADAWPTLEAKASASGAALVSPALNFCGPAASCNGTSPYQYLRDFFAACAGCRVEHVAVHWYNCDLPSLRDYLEPGGNLEGFEQFGKPIWLTEFSCDGSASVASQEAFMRAAIPYLEANPRVFRYSWFSADPIPNARLLNSDGSPTALGQVYIGLPGGCR